MMILLKTGIKSDIAKKKFYEFLKDCDKRSDYPNPNDIRYIVDKLDLHNVSQILFDYGERNLHCILKYFEHLEYYEFCAIIRDKIELHNRALGTNIKL